MSTIHVVPLDDLIAHDVPGGIDGHSGNPGDWLAIEATGPELDCPCAPRVEHCPSIDDAGPDGWLVVHHSLDGREAEQF